MALGKKDIVGHFERIFGQSPELVVRAPGRVNLIGEHTDYNDGFVFPLAIDRAAWIALRPRTDGKVVVHSIDFDQKGEFALEKFAHEKEGWLEYIKGTAWAMQDAGMKLCGWEGVMAGDVPLGAGLSSSAALEMATAKAFQAISGLEWNGAKMALLGQKAENRWVGVNCGIMDQLISACGKADHALLIDCRSLETQTVPFPPGTAVVVLDTATRRGLVDSAYNERRANCEATAAFFKVKALRDVTIEQFNASHNGLSPIAVKRARHVITENDRTVRAAEVMRAGNAAELGKLMVESHLSLRDDFEVSSDALNAMVDAALAHPACYGARMTGAGFGGCAMALIRAEAAADFTQATAAKYEKATGNKPAVYVCSATDGANLV